MKCTCCIIEREIGFKQIVWRIVIKKNKITHKSNNYTCNLYSWCVKKRAHWFTYYPGNTVIIYPYMKTKQNYENYLKTIGFQSWNEV